MRYHEPWHSELNAAAVLGRQRLKLGYWNRAEDENTEREVSPQRLVYHRHNWYQRPGNKSELGKFDRGGVHAARQ